MNELKERLSDLLKCVSQKAGDEFSGVGIIVYDYKTNLPITNLRDNSPVLTEDMQHDLARISSVNSEFHDGFHLISKDWVLTDIAQYFSPPICEEVLLDRQKSIGGRYAAAQFGSAIKGVLMIGIATKSMGVVLFQDGCEVYSEEVA